MNPALEIGKTLGSGRYVVEKILGIGGFGITYYVRHVELGAHYAIKEFFISGKCVRENDKSTVLLQSMDASMYAKLKKRFADEARTLVVLENPHVVRVIDIFDENNTSYIVMEFVPGITLQQKVEQEGKLSLGDALNCMGQLLEATSYIHEKHILHRDIKPDNVIITPDNRVVLIDFGSAREFVHDEVQNQTAILTHGYAPVEQYSITSKKGNYTDIYAVGGVFYFILTGVKPIDATSRLMEPLKEPIALNPDIPISVSQTIMKAMELKPEDRYQNVQEFMTDLFGSSSVSQEERSVEKPSGKKMWLWLSLSFSALLLVGVVMFLLFFRESDSHKYARMQQEHYQYLVNNCQMNIENGSAADYEKLFQAKEQLMEIEKIEKDCSPYYPEVYCSSIKMTTELEKKMKTVGSEWEQSAIAQLRIDEKENALSFFILAGELNPQSISKQYQRMADSLAYMRINSVVLNHLGNNDSVVEITYDGFYVSEQQTNIEVRLFDNEGNLLTCYGKDLLIKNKPVQKATMNMPNYPEGRIDRLEVWHDGNRLYYQYVE